MCGIVGAIAERNIVPILMEGLRRLEYRGYDSAGLAVLNGSKHLTRLRTVGKVKMLDEALEQTPTTGKVGIAHTRWATHGVPSERNAHPHYLAGRPRDRPQRHHRESRRAARRAEATGLQVYFGDRYRGHRPPHPPSPRDRQGPVQGGPCDGSGARGCLRPGGGERARSGPSHPRPRRLPGRRRVSASKRISSRRTSRRCCP